MKLFIPSEHNSIFDGLKKKFEVVDDIADCDWVLLWNDVNPEEQAIVHYARSLGKKTAVLQHGRRGTSKYHPPFLQKVVADKLLVWGEFDRRRLIASGQDPRKIAVVGTTVLWNLPPRAERFGTNVVFCPEHWDRPVEENFKVRDELRKLKGVKVMTKLIESHAMEDFDNPVKTNRNSSEHLMVCKNLLSTADLVVGVSESTFELLAQTMDIPVVIMDEWEPKAFGGDERYVAYERLISPAAKRTSLADLRKTVKDQLKHPDELKEERQRVAIDEGGIELDPLKEIERCLT